MVRQVILQPLGAKELSTATAIGAINLVIGCEIALCLTRSKKRSARQREEQQEDGDSRAMAGRAAERLDGKEVAPEEERAKAPMSLLQILSASWTVLPQQLRRVRDPGVQDCAIC